jgi:hypothetical protein
VATAPIKPQYGGATSNVTSKQVGSPGSLDESARSDHVHATNLLKDKSGQVLPFSFTGNPKKATVTFGLPFPGGAYSVSLESNEGRHWLIENPTLAGFTVSAQSNRSIIGTVYWVAKIHGEAD